VHNAELDWAVWPTIGLVGRRTRPASAGRARSERVPWHGSRWFTDGYPMAKLCTYVNPSNGASPGMAWPKVEAVDRSC
jgi:hypothetical protein